MKNELFRKVTWRDVFDFIFALGIALLIAFASPTKFHIVMAGFVGIVLWSITHMRRRIRELEKKLGDSD